MPNQKKSKKLKHNKKRNTAFLFEALVKELTKASIASDTDQRVAISKVLKKHFKKSGILFQELDLYRSVNEARDTDRITAERILLEAKRMYSTLSNDDIFSAQSALVDDINK
jgi:acetyl-CoA carboxylase alpha subunit